VLLGLVIVTAVLQLTILYIPFFDRFFQITPLNAGELLLCIGLGVLMLLLIEGEKAWLRRQPE
jgi:Ca2+-transporting ATPase